MEILKGVTDCISKVMEKYDAKDVASVGITNQRETLIGACPVLITSYAASPYAASPYAASPYAASPYAASVKTCQRYNCFHHLRPSFISATLTLFSLYHTVFSRSVG
jgi:hypothetical protein